MNGLDPGPSGPSVESGPATSESGLAASKSGPAGAKAPAEGMACARLRRAHAIAGAGALAPAGPDFEAARPDSEVAGPDSTEGPDGPGSNPFISNSAQN